MSTPTAFIRDWILKEHFEGKKRHRDGKEFYATKGIKQICLEQNSRLKSFRIIVVKKENKVSESQNSTTTSETSTETVQSFSKHNNIHTIGIELNPNFKFENYVVGKSNKLAYSTSKQIAEQTTIESNYNPLFIYSGVGLGKTHLIQSIAWHLKETQKDKVIVYMPAEHFMYKFVMALKNKTILDFKEQFRRIDTLIIDDIHFIAGKEGTQNEFFHTFNTLMENKKQIILACDRSPGDLNGIDTRLKSRINGGMIVDIYSPDYELRMDILKSKAKLFEIEPEHGVLELLAEKITTNARDLEGALKKLIANNKFTGEAINLENTKRLLKDLFRTSNTEVTVKKVQEAVAKYYKVTLADLKSKARNSKFAFPRQVAMYLAKKLTTKSLANIGEEFGGKNHATIIHACKKMEAFILDDLHLEGDIKEIEKGLRV
jgi:chromosomal replication initiator protein